MNDTTKLQIWVPGDWNAFFGRVDDIPASKNQLSPSAFAKLVEHAARVRLREKTLRPTVGAATDSRRCLRIASCDVAEDRLDIRGRPLRPNQRLTHSSSRPRICSLVMTRRWRMSSSASCTAASSAISSFTSRKSASSGRRWMADNTWCLMLTSRRYALGKRGQVPTPNGTEK